MVKQLLKRIYDLSDGCHPRWGIAKGLDMPRGQVGQPSLACWLRFENQDFGCQYVQCVLVRFPNSLCSQEGRGTCISYYTREEGTWEAREERMKREKGCFTTY